MDVVHHSKRCPALVRKYFELISIMSYSRWGCEAVIVSVSMIVVAAAGVLGAAAVL